MAPTMTTTPYAAKAAPRLAGGNVSTIMDCSMGASPPPPMPCKDARRRSALAGWCERPQSTDEDTVNSATENM